MLIRLFNRCLLCIRAGVSLGSTLRANCRFVGYVFAQLYQVPANDFLMWLLETPSSSVIPSLPISLAFHQPPVLFRLLTFATLWGAALMYISPTSNDVEHLFTTY